MYPYIKLGDIDFPAYNLLVGLSLIIGFKTFEKQEHTYNKNDFFIKKYKEVIFCINIIIGFAFAAIFENFFHRDFSRVGQYGITFYGGLVVAIPLNLLLLNFSLNRFVLLLNLATPALLLSHAIGRVGCYMAGCCYGRLISDFSVFSTLGNNRIPTQLVEAIMLIIIYFIVTKWVRFESRYLYYFILYGVIRFLLEFFRDDDRGNLFNISLSPAQVISVILILLALFIRIFFKFFSSNNYSQGIS